MLVLRGVKYSKRSLKKCTSLAITHANFKNHFILKSIILGDFLQLLQMLYILGNSLVITSNDD